MATDPTKLLDLWRPWLQLAPARLDQPILQGWTFNVNSNNSSAPATEADVVARHSYGRQLGRIGDALCALIRERAPDTLTEPLADFLALWDDIEDVKTRSATARLEQVVSDLRRLKASDAAAYKRLRTALRSALQASE